MCVLSGCTAVGKECKVRSLQLKVASIYIRVCGDEAEVGISPLWDNIGRHEYTAVGTAEEVLNELKQLAEDVLKAVKELEDMSREQAT
jgi:hypothetical protein